MRWSPESYRGSCCGSFTAGFESNLHQVEKDMEGVYLKVPDEVTGGEVRPLRRNMVVKSGRFGRFLACPGYRSASSPSPWWWRCRAAAPCGGRLMKRTGISKKPASSIPITAARKAPHLLLRHLRRACEGRLPCLRPHHVQKKSGRGSSVPSASTRRAKISCRRISEAIQADCCVDGTESGTNGTAADGQPTSKLSKRRCLTSPPPRKPPQLKNCGKRKAPLRKPARPKPPPKIHGQDGGQKASSALLTEETPAVAKAAAKKQRPPQRVPPKHPAAEKATAKKRRPPERRRPRELPPRKPRLPRKQRRPRRPPRPKRPLLRSRRQEAALKRRNKWSL